MSLMTSLFILPNSRSERAPASKQRPGAPGTDRTRVREPTSVPDQCYSVRHPPCLHPSAQPTGTRVRCTQRATRKWPAPQPRRTGGKRWVFLNLNVKFLKCERSLQSRKKKPLFRRGLQLNHVIFFTIKILYNFMLRVFFFVNCFGEKPSSFNPQKESTSSYFPLNIYSYSITQVRTNT
jgi:hypothetical protein